jgi:integral membrane protein
VAAADTGIQIPRSVLSALLRYRIVAYVVGVGLIVLVLIGVPLKYAGNFDGVVAVVGPLHGFLYIVYLLLTLDLARRIRLNIFVTLLVMLAGTIPFLSFVGERVISHYVLAPARSTKAHVTDTRS